MKFRDLMERIDDRILALKPQIMADGGTPTSDVETIVKSTLDALGFQISAAGDVFATAEPRRSEYDPMGSNVNRRFGRRRR